MRLLLTVCALLFLTANARAESYDFGKHGKVLLVLAGEWKLEHANLGESEHLFAIFPKNPLNNTYCELSVYSDVVDEFDTQAKLKSEMEDWAQHEVDVILPGLKAPEVKPIQCKKGFGFCFTVIDPSLVGKPPESGNAKQITYVLARLGPGDMVKAGIESDGDETEGYQQIFAAVEGLELNH